MKASPGQKSRPVKASAGPKSRPRLKSSLVLPPVTEAKPPAIEEDLIYGRHTVLAAIDHQRPLNRIWILPQLRRVPSIQSRLLAAKGQGIVVDEVDGQRLDFMTAQANHQGLVAQVGAYNYWELANLIDHVKTLTADPVIVAVDGITDPHNLGAIIRSAEAMGAHGLVIPQRRAVGINATVSKVAAGALETLAIARTVNLKQALDALRDSGFWVYGLTTDAKATMAEITFDGPIVIVIGSEDKGLSSVTQSHCDRVARIPLRGQMLSLNASVAAGMALYEIFRQRGTVTIPERGEA